MDWKLRFRNLRTGREVERISRERAELVSQARAVDGDIWSELLSATDPNGNVLTVDEVRRLVAAHPRGRLSEASRPAAGPTAPCPSLSTQRPATPRVASEATSTRPSRRQGLPKRCRPRASGHLLRVLDRGRPTGGHSGTLAGRTKDGRLLLAPQELVKGMGNLRHRPRQVGYEEGGCCKSSQTEHSVWSSRCLDSRLEPVMLTGVGCGGVTGSNYPKGASSVGRSVRG